MRRAALALVLVGLVLGVAGCGGGETVAPKPETVEGTLPTTTESTTAEVKGDPAAGEKVFASAGCGGCHTLKAAGATGTVGPNLDDKKPELQLIVDRVTNGMGVMPSFKNQLSEQQIADVAAYVFASTHGG
jgi:mono/diheme cytochrome c family protein